METDVSLFAPPGQEPIAVNNDPGVGLGPCAKIIAPNGSNKLNETSLSKLPALQINSILCPSQTVNVSLFAPPPKTVKVPIEIPSSNTVTVAPFQLVLASNMSNV